MEKLIGVCVDYWPLLLVCFAAIVAAVAFAIKFVNTPTNEQLIQVKSWLLYAVTEAEKQFGAKTGQVKLAYVYDLFAGRFPNLARMISFNFFSKMVDEVLETFRNMLESNGRLKEYVGEE